MYYVYILQSEVDASQFYCGKAKDLKARLHNHNSGQSQHTAKYKPWKVVWFGAFESPTKAAAFETYLKSASGKAFLRKRLINY